MNIGASFPQQLEIRGVHPPRLGFPESELDRDPSGSKDLPATAADKRERVGHRGNHAADSCPQDRIGARWGLAVVTARLQGDIERGVASRFTCRGKRVDLGVRSTEALMPA